MKSKFVDIAFGLFMWYFAYTRFENGQIWVGILFAVLGTMNLVIATMKHKGLINLNRKEE